MTAPPLRPQLLALDLDGTLIAFEEPIRSAVVAAVRGAMAAGIRATIVTGRMVAATQPYASVLGIAGTLVCYQGAVLADAATGHFGREIPLANAIALRAYEAGKAGGYHVQFYANDRFYVEEVNEFSRLYARVSGLEPVVVSSLREAFSSRDSTKVNLIMKPERTAACAELMREVCGPEAYVTRSNPEFVELLDPRVDKAEALTRVAASYGIPMDRVLAIGDSYNDVPMLRAAGFSVAMGTAAAEVKAEADAVVGGVDADGVAEAIERFVT